MHEKYIGLQILIGWSIEPLRGYFKVNMLIFDSPQRLIKSVNKFLKSIKEKWT